MESLVLTILLAINIVLNFEPRWPLPCFKSWLFLFIDEDEDGLLSNFRTDITESKFVSHLADEKIICSAEWITERRIDPKYKTSLEAGHTQWVLTLAFGSMSQGR